VNDFNLLGRTWQVNVQAAPRFRNEPGDITRLRVKNKYGKLVPLGAVAEVKEVSGPLVLSRYNMYPAAAINGAVAPGVSSGDAVAVFEELAKRELPANMAFEWTELTFIEQRSRATGNVVFGLSVFVVFLVLAALYESWALPLAVILVVPMCVACSLFGVWVTIWDHVTLADFMIDPGKWWVGSQIGLEVGKYAFNPAAWLGVMQPDVRYGVNVADAVGLRKQDVNVFTQVGFVVLIGLACKNSILIVEYAKMKREAGADARTAIREACQLRLRPILMTSCAFVLGVLPMVVATGAGSEMRQALGLAVFAGMLGVTAFGIFLTPAFFVLVDGLSGRLRGRFPWLGRLGGALAGVLSFRWVRPVARGVAAAVARR
jgi:multidrug efflux pump